MAKVVTNLHLNNDIDIYYPFACEELLCRSVGTGENPESLVHIWRHERAFVLGLRDSRLPYAKQAMEWLEQEGYRVMVRNSGGAAVPLDFGVVNVTLIQVNSRGSIDISRDFQRMADLLQASLLPLGVRFDAGEIGGSYCPGEYDLSIHGRKFCGLAQRRQLQAYAVQAFVNVEGSSRARADLVKEFYARAGGGEKSPGTLHIQAHTMGSINELSPGFPGSGKWLKHLKDTIAAVSVSSSAELLLPEEQEINRMIMQMKQRYDPRRS